VSFDREDTRLVTTGTLYPKSSVVPPASFLARVSMGKAAATLVLSAWLGRTERQCLAEAHRSAFDPHVACETNFSIGNPRKNNLTFFAYAPLSASLRKSGLLESSGWK